MKQRYPDLADRVVVGPGNEGTVYVYIPLLLDDEQNIEIHETMAEIGAQTVADTGIVIGTYAPVGEFPSVSPL